MAMDSAPPSTPQPTQAAVIGTGMMGPGIAASLALGGWQTTILSRSADGAQRGLASAQTSLQLLADHGLTDAGSAQQAAGRLRSSTSVDDTAPSCGLIVESAPEDMALKQDLFARLDQLTPPTALLASNTSSLSITAIASKCENPERVITAHFWNPPAIMRLVELVRGDKTSGETLTRTKAILEACGKKVVVVQQDRPGQLGNRLQHAVVREAIHIVAEGIATAEDVDTAAREGFGARLPVYGILEHQDAVGLDLVLAIQDYVNSDLASTQDGHAHLRELVKAGQDGIRSGQGFYDWTKKDFDAVKNHRDEFLLHFFSSRFPRDD